MSESAEEIRRVSSKIMHVFPMSSEQGVWFFCWFVFLSILFVLSSLYYRKCTFALCPQWVYILDVEGRLTGMTNLTV